MLSYEQCRLIAHEKAEHYNTALGKSYKLGNDYVFEAVEEFVGVFPTVVSTENGSTLPLWTYLNEKDLSMDDMQEIPVEK